MQSYIQATVYWSQCMAQQQVKLACLHSRLVHFITLSTGSARDNISQDTIKNILLPIPTRNILKLFDEKIGSIYQTIVNNYQQIDSLTKQRDELLPLLMNGQVSVNSDLSDD